MKTALVTACFLEGNDAIGNNRFDRNLRYLKFYSKIKGEVGFDDIILLDNHSPIDLVQRFKVIARQENYPLWFLRYDERLERGPGPNEYPYCWRALYSYANLMHKYDKIIGIDSDGFVLTARLARFINKCQSGWVTFWCETWGFPESSLMILCKDAFPLARGYFKTHWNDRLGRQMERDIPFTDVRRDFRCGRFGESGRPKQDETMDFYSQAPLEIDLVFKSF